MPHTECPCCRCALRRALEEFHATENQLKKYLMIDPLIKRIDTAIQEGEADILWELRARVLEKKGVLETYLFEGTTKH